MDRNEKYLFLEYEKQRNKGIRVWIFMNVLIFCIRGSVLFLFIMFALQVPAYTVSVTAYIYF